MDDYLGEVCLTCGRDGLRRNPTDKESRAPNRAHTPWKEEFYFRASINPPKETDCPHCLHSPPAHRRDCITRELKPEPAVSGVLMADG